MKSSMGEHHCRQFSLAEMRSATGDFSDTHVIGKGGFGSVYKGLIDNGSSIVAVKRLASNSKQGQREFVAEMETLSKLRHRNLVSLIGYCNEQGEMILVYEYMPNGTLADHLHTNNLQNSSLTWNQRLRICIGAARGLDYLHTGSSVIHRDVKPTNILLDENFRAKVADFGLAKNLSGDNLESHVSASVKGSFGYFNPSYFVSGRLTKASDTYAFGVVLLEVLSGRPAIDRKLVESELCLTMWAQEKIQNGKFRQIAASNLRSQISDDCLKTYVGVVKRCLIHEPKKRLSMTRAVVQLEFALEQQERKGSARKSQFKPFIAFWNRVIPSGSTKNDNNDDDVKQSFDESEEEKNFIELTAIRAIKLAEIKYMTDNFGSMYWLANGLSGGSTFRGVTKYGHDVVIKRHNGKLPKKEFVAQVSFLSRMRHLNVNNQVGYCVDGGVQISVHDFAAQGSLHDILHGRQGPEDFLCMTAPGLSWAQRMKIAVGAAQALSYFHGMELIHRNIKSSNVLVCANGVAQIADSHLSAKCPCCAHRVDNFDGLDCGYHPPEYGRDGYTKKGDIYNFGVVLIELLTGRKSFNVKSVLSMLRETNLALIVDARLEGDYPPKAVAKMAAVAAMCVQYKAEDRPSMKVVLESLQIATEETQDYIL